MFCEKCGTQIPDGGDTLCPRCRAAEAPAQPVQTQIPQPQQPAQPQSQQPMMQQPMMNVGGMNGNLANPSIVMLIKLVFGAISLWAAFGPLLKYISISILGFSFMDLFIMSNGKGEFAGFFVPLLILMIASILLALAGIILTILPKVAPQVKLPLPAFASVGATALSLICSIIGIIVTIIFIGKANGGAAGFSGFGIFMLIFSVLALAGSIYMSYVERKKK